MKQELADRIKLLGEALNSNDVQYMFIGGVAISFYGGSRPSSNLPANVDYDIDVWYSATYANFGQLMKAIVAIQPDLKNELKELSFDPRRAFIKFNVDNFHFDFLPEIKAFYYKDFSACYDRQEIGEIDGVMALNVQEQQILAIKPIRQRVE